MERVDRELGVTSKVEPALAGAEREVSTRIRMYPLAVIDKASRTLQGCLYDSGDRKTIVVPRASVSIAGGLPRPGAAPSWPAAIAGLRAANTVRSCAVRAVRGKRYPEARASPTGSRNACVPALLSSTARFVRFPSSVCVVHHPIAERRGSQEVA